MDSLIAVFQALPPALQTVALLFLAGSYAASHLISLSPTPAPNTTWGRLYAALEAYAGLYGKAKQIGIPVVTPQDVVNRLGAALAGGQTLTPDKLADILGTVAPSPAPLLSWPSRCPRARHLPRR